MVNIEFESDVVLNGSQTHEARQDHDHAFESDVVLNGSQTAGVAAPLPPVFESDVVLNGSQTIKFVFLWGTSRQDLS